MTCAGIIAGAIAGLTLAAGEPVIVGTDGPFPAYVLVDANGTITGFERDVMDEVCLRARLDCDWQLATFDQLIPGVMAGEFDVVLGGMAANADRRRLVDFTQSYYATEPEEWYIGRPGAPPPATALTAVQSGTVHEAHLKKLGLRHQAFPTEPQVLAALAEGRADLALGPFQTRTDIADFIQANGMDFLYSDLIHDDGIAMAVCKGNPLLESLDAALTAMRADGTLATLEARWFP
jgi:ABC-type amino acid transport substrate-binding protein